MVYELRDYRSVLATPYDVPILGYGAHAVNNLRLWRAGPVHKQLDLDAFNAGDYSRAQKANNDAEAITCLLYPDDNTPAGQQLRLQQEYFFVCAGLQSMLRTFRATHLSWDKLPERVAIHTNDTHPALCVPELMRLLMDGEGLSWEEAWDITCRTISYTNHTVMPEALEKWPVSLMRALLPRQFQIIEEIDRRWRDSLSEKLAEDGSSWTDVLRNTAILWDGQVRMANLSIIFSHSVNGVSALHSDILKRETFRDFAKLEPELFNNKTNGVTHRRFLREANPAYSKLITDAIGDGWLSDAYELEKLVPFESDASFLDAMDDARRVNKERLAAYVKETSGTVLDTNMVFDVQVKRFHAYKRQLLSVFKILDLRNRILDDANFDPQPTAFIFSGKAAQSYAFAKEVIRLINSLADVVNNDPRVSDKIRVAFVPNFAVSNAQYIYSAADISEQISLAGTEASGTSNMKLMMNGALTLGTLDGSNVEISELVGPENIKIFGMKTEEVEELQASGRYYAWDRYNADRGRLGRIVDQLTDGTLAGLSGNFESVRDHLMVENDPYLVMGDFHAYAQAWEELTSGYSDRRAWNKSALHNTAKAGFFSSDRTIAEYEADIWHIEA